MSHNLSEIVRSSVNG